jgi:hypothetical protein
VVGELEIVIQAANAVRRGRRGRNYFIEYEFHLIPPSVQLYGASRTEMLKAFEAAVAFFQAWYEVRAREAHGVVAARSQLDAAHCEGIRKSAARRPLQPSYFNKV